MNPAVTPAESPTLLPMLSRTLPWPSIVFLSMAIGTLLLILQPDFSLLLPGLSVADWRMWALAWGTGLWLVLLSWLAVSMPQALLDGPSVVTPWRGSIVAVIGLTLAVFLVWLALNGMAAVYAAFGLFVVLVLIGVRAALIKLNPRHGFFIAAHDALEVAMWTLWASLPWLVWEWSGRTFDAAWVSGCMWIVLALAVAALLLAHVPTVLQKRMRLLILVLVLGAALAWVVRSGGLIGASERFSGQRMGSPSTLVLTDAGCSAANSALEKRLCWFDPIARQGTLRNARIKAVMGDSVIVEINNSAIVTTLR